MFLLLLLLGLAISIICADHWHASESTWAILSAVLQALGLFALVLASRAMRSELSSHESDL